MKTLQLIILSLTVAFASCDLERLPYSSIDSSSSTTSYKDATQWTNGTYYQIRLMQNANYIFAQDVQADQLNATVAYGNNYGGQHTWVSFTVDDYVLSGTWSVYYNALANINTAINGFSGTTLSDSTQNATLKQYQGAWLLARAYIYNELLRRYAPVYNTSSASTDLGVPLLLTYDVNALPARASVQEVYDQILSDIAEAKTLLASTSGSQGATTFNIDVAYALEARVKLNMKDYDGAYSAAKQLIDGGTYTLYTTQSDLENYWHNDATQETIFQSFVSNPDELLSSPVGYYYLAYQAATDSYTPLYLPSQWVVDMFDDADYRKDVYFAQPTVKFEGITYPGLYVINKYPGNPSLWTESSTNYQHAPKVFRVAEQYLIAAEAAYFSSSLTDTEVLAPLNALRQARGLSSLSGISGTTLLEEVKNERFRELAFEGYRLFDLKRWGEGFTRRDPQNVDILTTGANYETKSVDASDNKFVWGIPARDTQINSNIVQNAGW